MEKRNSNNHEPTTIRCYVLRSVARCGQGMCAVSYRVVDDASSSVLDFVPLPCFVLFFFFLLNPMLFFIEPFEGNDISSSLGYSHLLHTFTLEIPFSFKLTRELEANFFIWNLPDHRHTVTLEFSQIPHFNLHSKNGFLTFINGLFFFFSFQLLRRLL